MATGIDLLKLTASFVTEGYVFAELSGQEQISRPFAYRLRLESGQAQIAASAALDQPVSIAIAEGTDGTPARYLNAIVSGIVCEPSNKQGMWTATLTVVPKLWFMGQTRASRFYHNKSATDILQAVLSPFGISPTMRTSGTYAAMDYVVQYNESYLDFFQRVIEEHGLFYFFEHSESDCTLVIADYNQAFKPVSPAAVSFITQNQTTAGFDRWTALGHTMLGAVRIDDYDPTTVSLAPGSITASQNATGATSGASLRKSFTWPARSPDAGTATGKSDARMTANEGAAALYAGDGRVPQLYAGGKFTLADPISGGDTDYIVQSLSLVVSDRAAQGAASGVSTHCTAFAASANWNEPLTMPRPVMAGLYSAIVVGASGEEIYTDKFGRIQVRFPWDTEGDIAGGSTVWVRVIQPWGGNNWGVQFIPRVGMEVAVAFLEGDVDRPVVVGSLYNFDNAPTFPLGDKNKSGWRTRSTLQGGTSNFSEWSFDDTKGSELVYLHAEKDHTVEVENDETTTIGHDRTEEVKNNETITIDKNRTETVKGDESLTVQGKQTETITGNRAVTVSQGNDSLTVSTGSLTVETSASGITMKAATSITLQVGGNSIKIDTTGITISALKITVSAETALQASGATVQVSGQGETQVSAGGSVMISGAAVMIN